MNFHDIGEEKGEDPREHTKTHSETPESPVGCRKENDCYENHKANAKARNEAKEEVA
jgi:hypothetical protein